MKQFLPPRWRGEIYGLGTNQKPLYQNHCSWRAIRIAAEVSSVHVTQHSVTAQADARLTSPTQISVLLLLMLSLGPRWLLSFSVQDEECEMLSFASQKHFISKSSSSGGKRGFKMPDAEACVFKGSLSQGAPKRLRWCKGFSPHGVDSNSCTKPGSPAVTCLWSPNPWKFAGFAQLSWDRGEQEQWHSQDRHLGLSRSCPSARKARPGQVLEQSTTVREA